MTFNINETLAQMMQAMKDSLSNDWDLAKKDTAKLLDARKAKLELLSQLYLDGDISEEKLKLRMEDERLIIEAELHAIAVVSKVSAQNAANAAITIFSKAIIETVKAII